MIGYKYRYNSYNDKCIKLYNQVNSLIMNENYLQKSVFNHVTQFDCNIEILQVFNFVYY